MGPARGFSPFLKEAVVLQVQVKASVGSFIPASTPPRVTGGAMASQNDGAKRQTENNGQEVPAGLRVLHVGRAEGLSEIFTCASTCHAWMASVVDGNAKCVKGLAVVYLAGQRLVVCYDRARSLRMIPVGDL